MVTAHLVISNKLGLHARAATKFSNVANQFSSTIKVTCGGKTIDGKSIMSLMLLAASIGTEIEISADGRDEDSAIEALATLINNKFDEGE